MQMPFLPVALILSLAAPEPMPTAVHVWSLTAKRQR